MGRSVWVPRDAAVTIYFTYDSPEDLGEYWDALVCDIQNDLCQIGELEWEDYWAAREEHVIAENHVVRAVLCEYCGICSLSLVPVEEPYENVWEPLKNIWGEFAAEWALKYDEEIATMLRGLEGVTVYERVGGFSNGESVYAVRN